MVSFRERSVSCDGSEPYFVTNIAKVLGAHLERKQIQKQNRPMLMKKFSSVAKVEQDRIVGNVFCPPLSAM